MQFTLNDVYWTAGFITTEGSCVLNGRSPRMIASQVEPYPLDKLVRLWGGTLRWHQPRGVSKHPYQQWALGGPVAVGLMQMVYDLVSPSKQQQIRHVLAKWQTNGGRAGETHAGAALSDVQALEAMRCVIDGERLTQVAARYGISHATLVYWLQGVRRPSLLQALQSAGEVVPDLRWNAEDPVFVSCKKSVPLVQNLHWAAGFLDGDGCFSSSKNDIRIQGIQGELAPLQKLQSLWGGTIYPTKRGVNKPIHTWHLNGSYAAALMMTLYPLMSPGRQAQMHATLGRWRERGAVSGELHAGATVSDADALVAMRHVWQGRSLELVAESIGVTRHALSLWMRGVKRPYLVEQLQQEGLPCKWRYNGGRRVPHQVADDVALDALRRVMSGEPKGCVARELDIKPILLTEWLSGKNRPYLLARLQQEDVLTPKEEVPHDGCEK